MLPVKNESWVLEHCLSSLSFCDEIIAIDDNSTDSTRSILEKYNCTIVDIDTNTKVGWKEYEIRTHLLKIAREHQATHLIAIDADEIFSDSFVIEAREFLSKLSPGESISLPWINICSSETIMSNSINKVFIMADDKKSTFDAGFIHIPRVPTSKSTITLSIPYAVVHLQYLNKTRNYYKRIWYMMSELLHKKRSAYRINTTYSIMKELNEIYFDVNQIYKKVLPDPKTDTNIWQKNKVHELFNAHGYKYFEKLDIWEDETLLNNFIKETNRRPRVEIPNKLLLKLNKIKNNIKNAFKL
jgi:glycosyltransferase involved in cell wall biosynthesis